MKMFDKSKITKVYSGRKGCACGCRGKYSYGSKYISRRPSYYDHMEGVSDRTVSVITNRVMGLLQDQNAPVERVIWEDNFVAVDLMNDRTYTLYFT